MCLNYSGNLPHQQDTRKASPRSVAVQEPFAIVPEDNLAGCRHLQSAPLDRMPRP